MKKQAIEWDAMEPEWRAGIKSKKELSEEYGVSRAAIDKHWAKLRIERDLTEKIRQEAEALVTRAAVTREVTPESRVTEREIIEVNAQMQATKLLEHRTDIGRYRKLCQTMLAELEAESDNPEIFAELGEILAKPDEKGQDRLNDAYRKAISLPQRIDGVKKLAETLKTLIGLERQAFGIADSAEGDKPVKEEAVKESAIVTARRVGFLLAKGLKEVQQAKPE